MLEKRKDLRDEMNLKKILEDSELSLLVGFLEYKKQRLTYKENYINNLVVKEIENILDHINNLNEKDIKQILLFIEDEDIFRKISKKIIKKTKITKLLYKI